MYSTLVTISYEQASDLIEESEIMSHLDLGAADTYLLNHATKGKLAVTSCHVTGLAAVMSV